MLAPYYPIFSYKAGTFTLQITAQSINADLDPIDYEKHPQTDS